MQANMNRMQERFDLLKVAAIFYQRQSYSPPAVSSPVTFSLTPPQHAPPAPTHFSPPSSPSLPPSRQPSKRAPSSTNPYQQLQPPHPTYTNCNHLTPLSTLHTSHLTEAHPTHRLLGPIPTIVCGAWSTSILAIGPHLRSNTERWEGASVATLTTNTRGPTGLSFAAWGRGKGTVVLTTTHPASQVTSPPTHADPLGFPSQHGQRQRNSHPDHHPPHQLLPARSLPDPHH